MQLNMPEDVNLIIKKLQDAGYEAYAVGGCVRDSYMGAVPHDWDITTSALPGQVKELFRRTIDVGIQHGTVVVMMGKEGYEVTTYRIDGVYEDNRHPKQVSFTPDLKEDLKRRDFTINAMAYSEKTGIVDLFGGKEDIRRGIIRAVGNPKERFSEDALRIMRALRFAARFNYEIDKDTEEAIRELAPNLSTISAERVRDELEKMILSDHPDIIRKAYEYGITRIVFPEWDEIMKCEQNTPYHFLNVGEHTILAMQRLVSDYPDISDEDKRVLRLAALLHDIGKPKMKTTDENGVNHFKGHPRESKEIASKMLRRLKYDNDTIDRVLKLVLYHDTRPVLTAPNVRRMIIDVGKSNMCNLLRLKQVDMEAQSDYRLKERIEDIRGLTKLYEQIIENGDCLSISDLAVNGRDLIDRGYKEGPQLGKKLKEIFEAVIEDPTLNNREALLKMV